MLFSERKRIAEEYELWLKENPFIEDCIFSVLSFLDWKGYLKPQDVRKCKQFEKYVDDQE